MGTDRSGAPGTDPKFWDGFLEAVRAQGVRAPYDRWYVVRAEQYLKAHPDTPLSMYRPEEVSAYLTEIGRKGGLKDWQFRQVVEALETMFCKVVVVPWAGRFDWGYWKDSARSLEPHHATIARDTPLSRPSGLQDRQEAGPGLGPVRGTHGEVLYALIAEIRRPALRHRDAFGVPNAGMKGSVAGMSGPRAGMKSPLVRMNVPGAGMKSPLPGMKSPPARVNGPLAGIRASEARVSHSVGGKRTRLARAAGPETPRDARRSRRIAVHGGHDSRMNGTRVDARRALDGHAPLGPEVTLDLRRGARV